MNKKFYIILFAVLAFALVLSACGAAPEAPAAEAEEAAAAEEAEDGRRRHQSRSAGEAVEVR